MTTTRDRSACPSPAKKMRYAKYATAQSAINQEAAPPTRTGSIVMRWVSASTINANVAPMKMTTGNHANSPALNRGGAGAGASHRRVTRNCDRPKIIPKTGNANPKRQPKFDTASGTSTDPSSAPTLMPR